MGSLRDVDAVVPDFGVLDPDQLALTPRGKRTRARLVQAARELLEDVGYPAATVTEVTRRSGVSLGTFYRYFDNKEELFLLLLRSLVETLYDSVGGVWRDDDVQGSLKDTTKRYLTAYCDNGRLIAALRDMASSVPEAAQLWWELRMHTYRRMVVHLTEVAEKRGLQPDLAVAALGGMVEQFAYFWYVEGERYGRQQPSLDDAAFNLSQLWYRSIYLDGG
jgi:AcrR family transcriptional regulator